MASPSDARFAGMRLLDFISKGLKIGWSGMSDIPRSAIPKLLNHELALIDHCFANRYSSEDFGSYYLTAVRLAIDDQSWEIVGVLLGYDESHMLLEHDEDLVYRVLKRACGTGFHDRPYGESHCIPNLVQLLVEHGAPVTFADKERKTALYIACEWGFSKVFNILVKAGAAYDTPHDPIVMDDGRVINIFAQEPYSPDHHLLRCTLNHYMKSEDHGKGGLKNRWGPIILFLLKHGQQVSIDDRALTKVFHDACYQAYVPLIEYLVALGVDINMATKGGGFYDHDYSGSALHAAAMAGEKEIVKLLISMGADVTAKRMQSRIRGAHETTAAATLLHWKLGNPKPLHETCELLIEAGVSEDDGNMLLDHCTREDDVGIVQRLLILGFRIPQISFEKIRRYGQHDVNICVGVVRLLVEHGFGTNNPAALQTHAAGRGNISLLEYLIDAFGKNIDPADFCLITYTISHSKAADRVHMLRYLVEDCGFNVNASFRGLSNYGSPRNRDANFLLIACHELNSHAVRVLLELGADVDCPGLELTVWALMRDKVRSQQEGYHLVLPILRLLAVAIATKRSCTTLKYYADLNDTENIRSIVAAHLPSNMASGEDTIAHKSGLDKQKGIDVVLQPVPPQATTTFDAGIYRSLIGWKPIRLLHIEPSATNNLPLEVTFVHTTLGESPEFEVLSYVASNTGQTAGLVIDGNIQFITNELFNILYRFRKHNSSRLLWLDQLCINSHDLVEKSHQISLLKEICGAATQIIAYLGPEADNSHLLYERIADWKPLAEALEAGEKDTGIFEEHDDSRWHDKDIEDQVEEAYCKLLQRPWFFDPWTLLHLVHCKEATAICGDDEQDLFILLNIMQNRPRPPRFNPTDHPCYQGIGGEAADRLYSIESLMDSFNMTHKTVLECSKKVVASDLRDMIFGAVSLFKRPIMEIDYGLSIQEVYQGFTESMISMKSNLVVTNSFCGVSKIISNLPSWVPDWSKLGSLLEYSSDMLDSPGYPPLHLFDPSLRFEGRTMITKGLHLDRIHSITAAAPPLTLPYDTAFQNTLQGWEHLATTLSTRKSFPPTIAEAFCSLLTRPTSRSTETRTGVIERYAAEFNVWYKLHGTGPLEALEPSFFAELEAIRKWLGPLTAEEKRYKQSDEKKAESAFKVGVERLCEGERMFTTDRGMLGIAKGGDVRVGDDIVWLAGGYQSFVLRRKGDEEWEVVGDCSLYALDIVKVWEEMKEQVIRFRVT
ncbi:hypothetical protein BDV96DRAFT_649977 [Lophiotrema nucula]|uniref:Heterokaryon incompatibility domain-containing protein n=1 Tax=Lophiotrema nucula TaxID=690887 RepID=A0A6A5YXT9_9PLEO|nr:hypothetical protein BDV96DRAFT_649977 [Lophiotrema nucula]